MTAEDKLKASYRRVSHLQLHGGNALPDALADASGAARTARPRHYVGVRFFPSIAVVSTRPLLQGKAIVKQSDP
jgi:hypothetical protein